MNFVSFTIPKFTALSKIETSIWEHKLLGIITVHCVLEYV